MTKGIITMAKTKIGGYDIAEEDRKSIIHTKHLCGICDKVVKTAIQTTCGHRYCFECFEHEFVKGVAICVICKTQLTRDKIFRDKFADREIQGLILLCIYCVFGCKWRGQLRHREEHHKNCKFIPLPCVNHGCDKQVTKDTLPQHLQNECLYREVICSYCKQPVIHSKQKEHEQQCSMYPVACDHCGDEFPRNKIKTHLDPSSIDACKTLTTQCPFVKIGCKDKAAKKQSERKSHLQEGTTEHLNLLLSKFLNVLPYLEDLIPAKPNGKKAKLPQVLQLASEEMLSRVNSHVDNLRREIEERIQVLEAKYDTSMSSSIFQGTSGQELLRRMENSDAKCADLEFLLAEAHTTIGDLRQEVTKANVKLEKAEETIRKFERRLEEQENVTGIRNLAIADLEEKISVSMNNSTDGILVWRIDQVARRRAEATSGRQLSFYSPPFYTDPHGYKMCARMYLNGDGMGKGTHISLFFVIMRGEYDALLKWPFRQKVTMMLMDQDSEEHVIDAFRPDPNSSSFQRPKGAMNIASGCPMFCPHSELQRHSYIRDDVMFIKIIVDRPDWK